MDPSAAYTGYPRPLQSFHGGGRWLSRESRVPGPVTGSNIPATPGTVPPGGFPPRGEGFPPQSQSQHLLELVTPSTFLPALEPACPAATPHNHTPRPRAAG